MAYNTPEDLEAALSSNSYAAIFSDNNDGAINLAVVTAILARSDAMTDAWIAPVYNGPFPINQVPIPGMVKELAMQYALAFAYERRPDYTRTLEGSAANDADRWKRADAMGERLQQAVLRIPDLVSQSAPANVGGYTADEGSRIIIDSVDGSSNEGDF